MRKLFLLPLFVILALGVKAQDSTSLFQNFNLCDSNAQGYFPPGWSVYNVTGDQVWQCYSLYGMSNSPCLEMNGYASSSNWANEDWLFTPKLNLSSYSSIYLNFYAIWKYAGDSLHVMVSNNYTIGSNPTTSGTWVELPHTGSMAADTLTFHAFKVNLTPYKSTPCVVGFKYTSSTSDGSRWNIDSVFTSGLVESGVKNIEEQHLSLNTTGTSTTDHIALGINAAEGQYLLAVYDMVGRKIYSEILQIESGRQTYTITNQHLAKGMYVIKLSNESAAGVAKTIVE